MRQVRWAEQLFAKSRVKRFPMPDPEQELQRVKRLDEINFIDDRLYSRRKPLFNDELWGQEWYLVSVNCVKIALNDCNKCRKK